MTDGYSSMESSLRDSVTSPSSNRSSLPTDTHHNQGLQHGSKRQKLTSSSRGVANLTPDQLAKKRANDREAQRAIRERTKNQIETLEQRIQELTSQQPYQDLQSIRQQKDAIQAENEEIKSNLASALHTLQSCIGATAAAPSWRYAHEPTIKPPSVVPAVQPQQNLSSPYHTLTPLRTRDLTTHPSPHSPYASAPHNVGLPTSTQPSALRTTPASAHVARHDGHPSGGHTSGEKLDLGFVLDPNTQQHPHNSTHSDERSRHHPTAHRYHPTSSPARPAPNPYHILYPSPEFYNSGLSAHNAPLRNIHATCSLDNLLLDFRRDQRQRLIEGVRMPEIIGPPYPDFSSLIEPERSKYVHPLSRVHTELVAMFPHLCDLPEQVAVLHIMFLTMRWSVSRLPETYDDMPDWITPRPSQLLTPHPAWMDNIPWPKMRDKMVFLYPEVHFDDFFIPYTIGLSLNWPHHPADVLLKVEGKEELRLNPEFERHLRDLQNWSLGPEFIEAFPKLDGMCPIRKKPAYIP